MPRYDLTTPAGRFKAKWDYVWKDHAFLRRWFMNAHWLGPDLVRTNQPSPRQLAYWKSKGIRTVINLRGARDEAYIRIVETGLRPGEKLYEELLSDAESTIPTHHPKIMIAKVRQYSAETIDPIFNQMTYSSMNGSTDNDMVKLLKQLVPEFISLNSEYSKLD